MKQDIAITDVTRMSGRHVCIAGYSRQYQCVRPVRQMGSWIEDWLYDEQGALLIRPSAIVEFDFWKPRADHPPHTEDWLIDPHYRVVKGHVEPHKLHALLTKVTDPCVEAIFGAPIYTDPGWYIRMGEGCRSIGTVVPQGIGKITFTPDRGSYQILFKDQADHWYRLTITDAAFRAYAKYVCLTEKIFPDEVAARLTRILRKRPVLLRIGLSRGWAKFPDRCFLQINAIYTFPDYLQGRSFADFVIPSDS